MCVECFVVCGDWGVLWRFSVGIFFLMFRLPPIASLTDALFPYTTLVRSLHVGGDRRVGAAGGIDVGAAVDAVVVEDNHADQQVVAADGLDRKSTRLNSSH